MSELNLEEIAKKAVKENSMSITDLLKEQIESAKEDYKKIEDFYETNLCLPKEVSWPEETYEKGYLEGLKYALKIIEKKRH